METKNTEKASEKLSRAEKMTVQEILKMSFKSEATSRRAQMALASLSEQEFAHLCQEIPMEIAIKSPYANYVLQKMVQTHRRSQARQSLCFCKESPTGHLKTTQDAGS